jgi:hypothetical protein
MRLVEIDTGPVGPTPPTGGRLCRDELYRLLCGINPAKNLASLVAVQMASDLGSSD